MRGQSLFKIYSTANTQQVYRLTLVQSTECDCMPNNKSPILMDQM